MQRFSALRVQKTENIETITIKCNEVVQEQEVNSDSVNFDTSTIKTVHPVARTRTHAVGKVSFKQNLYRVLLFLKKKKEKTRYNNEEFDPGSG